MIYGQPSTGFHPDAPGLIRMRPAPWREDDAQEAPGIVPGPAATIAVGTVGTGAPGSPATVFNSGTSSAAVLDFSIPQGFPGTPADCSGSEPLGACAAAESAAKTASEPIGSCATAEAAAKAASEPAGTCGGGFIPIGGCNASFEPIGCPTKSAIVPTESGPKALYCMEAPQTWFIDVLDYPLKGCCHPIDPIFFEVCEPNSVRVLAVHARGPVSVFAKLDSSGINFRWSSWCTGELAPKEPIMVSVTIGGIRKGTMGNRFATKTVEEMDHNNAWWQNAQKPTAQME